MKGQGEREREVRGLLQDCDPHIAADVEHAAYLPFSDFRTELFSRFAQLDSQIGGAGTHYVIWDEATPLFPYAGPAWDGIVRPLLYTPYGLAALGEGASRLVLLSSGGHVEGCIDAYCSSKGLPQRGRQHIGSFVSKISDYLGPALTDRIRRFTQLAPNVGKHGFDSDKPAPVTPMPTALTSYFVARLIGITLLQHANLLADLEEAMDTARAAGRVYPRPRLAHL